LNKEKNGQDSQIAQSLKNSVINKSIVEEGQETKAKNTQMILKRGNLSHTSKKEMKRHMI